jgi:hypothetical protein
MPPKMLTVVSNVTQTLSLKTLLLRWLRKLSSVSVKARLPSRSTKLNSVLLREVLVNVMAK